MNVPPRSTRPQHHSPRGYKSVLVYVNGMSVTHGANGGSGGGGGNGGGVGLGAIGGGNGGGVGLGAIGGGNGGGRRRRLESVDGQGTRRSAAAVWPEKRKLRPEEPG